MSIKSNFQTFRVYFISDVPSILSFLPSFLYYEYNFLFNILMILKCIILDISGNTVHMENLYLVIFPPKILILVLVVRSITTDHFEFV